MKAGLFSKGTSVLRLREPALTGLCSLLIPCVMVRPPLARDILEGQPRNRFHARYAI